MKGIVGIWANPDKDSALSVTRQVIAELEREKIEVRLLGALPEWIAHGIQPMPQRIAAEQLQGLDAVLVVGGDGTLLHCARHMLELPADTVQDDASQNDTPQKNTSATVPLLGVNMGRLGFLAEIEVPRIPWAIDRFAAGQYTVETAMTLEVQLPDGSCKRGLNDISLTRMGPRILVVQASLEAQLIDRYPADGVIVASPMGATGYSLSAGGPIVSPLMDCLLLTPVCAHALQARPIVLDAAQEVCLEADADAKLSIDGQDAYTVHTGETVLVRRSRQRLAFLRLEERNFYSALRSKMHNWTETRAF